MHSLFDRLEPFIAFVVRRPILVLTVALLTAVVGADSTRHLRIDTDFANLVPEDYESVIALNKLRETVGGESEVSVAIVSPEFEANRQFAEAFIPRALELHDASGGESYLSRVDYIKDTSFLESNALYFATWEELDQLETFLNDKIEEAKLKANPFFFELDDEDLDEEDTREPNLDELYADVVGKEYPVSDDSTVLVLQFYPSGSQTDIGYLTDVYGSLEMLADELDPAGYHPEMEIVFAGRLQRTLVEVEAVREDILRSFGVGVSIVLLFVVLYFGYKSYVARVGGTFRVGAVLVELARVPLMVILIGLPLVISLAWTFGVAFAAYGTLNLMTSTLGLVLFGLGIDYGIHFFARYSEERGRGNGLEESIVTTFKSTGQAVSVGAASTSAGLFVLMLADFKGFSQFGFIAGTGILLALIAMMTVMPAMLSLLDRTRLVRLESTVGGRTSAKTGGRFAGSRPILLGSVLAILAAAVMLPPSFEYEFGNLEPTYEAYNVRTDIVRQVYPRRERRNPAYVVVDDPADVRGIVDRVREISSADTLSPTIAGVESLQDRFPATVEEEEHKLSRIASIRSILSDPLLGTLDANEDLDRLKHAAQTRSAIHLDDVPEYLKERYVSKSGEIGQFVLIYPSVGLSNGRNSIAFADDVGRIELDDGREFYAGSTSLVAADMLKLMRREAPWMIFATFAIVAVLMLLNFGSIKWASLALAPLIVGVLWMILIMEVFDIKLTFYNLIVLPAVLGIGNDAGVHIVHRYREEGKGSLLYVIRSTGEHITMGSLTTMIGFAGPLLSFHPGLRTIGVLAVVGIGTTLLAALVFLPAMLQIREDLLPASVPAVPTGDGIAGEITATERSEV